MIFLSIIYSAPFFKVKKTAVEQKICLWQYPLIDVSSKNQPTIEKTKKQKRGRKVLQGVWFLNILGNPNLFKVFNKIIVLLLFVWGTIQFVLTLQVRLSESEQPLEFCWCPSQGVSDRTPPQGHVLLQPRLPLRNLGGWSTCLWMEMLLVGRVTGTETGVKWTSDFSVVHVHASKSRLLWGGIQHAGNGCLH